MKYEKVEINKLNSIIIQRLKLPTTNRKIWTLIKEDLNNLNDIEQYVKSGKWEKLSDDKKMMFVKIVGGESHRKLKNYHITMRYFKNLIEKRDTVSK